MSSPLLLKGFEVELYTGRPEGTVVGCSAEVAAALEGFVTEPDCRNLEYITPPAASYATQLALLLEPRRRLRPWLAQRGLTLLPGSTLSTGDSQRFERSDPKNPYHAYIEATYGTRVVTASVHINLGLTDPDQLFAACRLVRCEAALLLALSACSPFVDGEVTGAHSQRWLQVPLTPEQVPLFLNHGASETICSAPGPGRCRNCAPSIPGSRGGTRRPSPGRSGRPSASTARRRRRAAAAAAAARPKPPLPAVPSRPRLPLHLRKW